MTSEKNLRRDFTSREDLIAYLRQEFPKTGGDHPISPILGGRKAAETALHAIDPVRYAKTRNFFDGAITKLSPYIRYGVLSLAEVRDAVLQKIQHRQEGEKLINELGWRDYWQRLYRQLGDEIWQDQEPYKTGYCAADYASQLPDDVQQATTGLVCIDQISQDLQTLGYLHNHGRMWMAAYLVHWRRIRWQVGAKWFLSHLLDGDPASNNLSWQWVASTFSQKPYFFNRENLEKYTHGVYCRNCPLYGNCDFEGSYEALEERLFPQAEPFDRGGGSRSFQKGRKPPKDK